MEKRKKKTAGRTILLFTAGTALTVASFVAIPPLIQKYGNRIYKVSLKREAIDFDNMGSEVAPNETMETNY